MILIRYNIIKQNYLVKQWCFSLRNIESFSNKPDPHTVKIDYVGPPDEKSNLRPYVRYIPENETTLQKRLRLKQLEVEVWNQKFWSNHNERFCKEKKQFMHLFENKESSNLSADEISKFYKHFLDRNRKIHVMYNTCWYIKNFELLMLELKVNIESAIQKIKHSFQ